MWRLCEDLAMDTKGFDMMTSTQPVSESETRQAGARGCSNGCCASPEGTNTVDRRGLLITMLSVDIGDRIVEDVESKGR
jgi:hypothetical protein